MFKNLKKDGKPLPETICIKLTGDGTQINRVLNIVNFAYTIIEEEEVAMSVRGNHCIAILKIYESDYNQLFMWLKRNY